jgi:hypothetical protein
LLTIVLPALPYFAHLAKRCCGDVVADFAVQSCQNDLEASIFVLFIKNQLIVNNQSH